MDGNAMTALYGVGLIAVPLLLSLTLHEFGHARTAQAFGDHTARLMGRCTLNPLAHLDLLGTICFFFAPVGWAKPVPVDSSRLRPARLGDIAVSLAGVGMNLLLATAAFVGLNVLAAAGVTVNHMPDSPPTPGGVAAFMLSYTVLINLSLLFFNLIPLFPLDGHHVARELLPWHAREGFMRWQGQVGQFVLMALLAGPWLMRQFDPHFAFNPIGSFLGRVMMPLIGHATSQDAFRLFHSAMSRYGVYLAWYQT